jgi:hypothetical protein
MSRNDPSQGTVADPAQPHGHRVPEPDNMARLRQIQRDVNAADRAATTPRPPQQVSDKQDWHTG